MRGILRELRARKVLKRVKRESSGKKSRRERYLNF